MRLTVRLAGPPGLDRVDTLTVAIADDAARWADHALPGGPSREEIERQIWGPAMFQTGGGPGGFLSEDAGRSLRYGRPLMAGESLVYILGQTFRPPWSEWSEEEWRKNAGATLRLSITATHAEYGSWTLPGELDLSGIFLRTDPARTVLPARHS